MKFSGVIFYIAALILPIVFSTLVINHEDRVAIFAFVVLNIILCFLYAGSYKINSRAADLNRIPRDIEEAFLLYSGGFFQLCALAYPYSVLQALKPTRLSWGRYEYPEVTFDLLGKGLVGSIAFFLLGRSLVALFRRLPAESNGEGSKM
jgi:hypothetical protein